MQSQKTFKPSGFSNWAKFFIDKYKITILLLIAVIVAGIMGVRDIPKQDFPDIPANMLIATAVYPGANAEDIEREVIIPLENRISEVEGIKTLRSSASNNFGSIFIELSDFKDLDKKVSEVQDQTSKVVLPDDVDVAVTQIDITGPTLAYAVTSDNFSQTELLEKTPAIVSYLETTSSEIKSVDVVPSAEMEIQVILDYAKLNSLGLSKDAVVSVLKGVTSSLPGGFVTSEDGKEKAIVIESEIGSIEDIKNISFGPMKLGDFAEVKRAPSEEGFTLAGFIDENGDAVTKESLYILVTKKGDGDVLRVSDSVKEAVEKIYDKKVITEDIDFNLVYDTSPYVRSLIKDLSDNGLVGLVIILVVLLFFVSLRAGILVSIILPISFLITWFVMPLIGYTLNILTLFAMILSLGMLVDNAIVISSGMLDNLKRGMDKKTAALKSVKDYAPAILSATVTTIIALIPYTMMGGIMGEFFKYIPIILIIMLVASYFLAISITPLFGQWILGSGERKEKKFKKIEKILFVPVFAFYAQKGIDKLVDKYYSAIRKVFSKKKNLVLTIVIPVVLLVVSFGYFLPKLPFSQFPTSDAEQLNVSVKFPTGTPLSEKKELYNEIGEKIVAIPHFESFFFWEGSFMVFIEEPKDRDSDLTAQDISDMLDDELEKFRIDERVIAVSPQSYGPPSSEFDVVVEFASSDTEKTAKLVDDIENFVKDKDGIERISNGPKDLMLSAVSVDFDSTKLAQLQSNVLFGSMSINSVFSESEAGKVVVRDDGVSDKLVVKYNQEAREDLDDLKNVSLSSSSGVSSANIGSVAAVKEVEKLNSISRLGKERISAISIKMDKDGDGPALETEIKNYLSEDKLNEFGLELKDVKYGGEYASVMESSSNLQVVFTIALILVYLVLVYQFNSYGQPFVIMLTIPFGLIGVFPSLFAVGSTLDMVSGLGVIALVGIVVNNAIVYIDSFNKIRKLNPEFSLAQSLSETGRSRLKPILSTTLTTIVGIIPLAIYDPFWTGLGTALISGLIFSSLGTLFVIPALIYAFSRKKNRGLDKKWQTTSALDDLI